MLDRPSAALDLAYAKARELCRIALTTVAALLAPVQCTPPGRLQSTSFDGRSPGLRVVATRAFPDDQWLRRGLVAYSCGGSSGFGIIILPPASLFTSRGRTIDWDGIGSVTRGQPLGRHLARLARFVDFAACGR